MTKINLTFAQPPGQFRISAAGIQGPAGPAGTVADGDKGDITVSASGATWRVDPNIKIGLSIALAARVFMN